jgi:hypothetical protein
VSIDLFPTRRPWMIAASLHNSFHTKPLSSSRGYPPLTLSLGGWGGLSPAKTLLPSGTPHNLLRAPRKWVMSHSKICLSRVHPRQGTISYDGCFKLSGHDHWRLFSSLSNVHLMSRTQAWQTGPHRVRASLALPRRPVRCLAAAWRLAPSLPTTPELPRYSAHR